MTPARVAGLDFATARRMVETFHYSHRMPKGRNVCLGWWLDDVAELAGAPYAAAVFGNGVNCYQADYLARVTGLPVTETSYVELKRLVRVEPRHPTAQLTAFLPRCFDELAALGYRHVVAFSDPDEGHTGAVYKAANFVWLGQTQEEWHVVDRDGVRRHRRVAYRHAKLHGMSIAEARDALGLTRVRTAPRDRWFWAIDRRERRQLRRLLAARQVDVAETCGGNSPEFPAPAPEPDDGPVYLLRFGRFGQALLPWGCP